jgi:hypothetical protein
MVMFLDSFVSLKPAYVATTNFAIELLHQS